jgi:aldehyde dehydrogenase (NAD+)
VCISAQHARVEASALNAFREALIAETLVDEAVRLGARLLVGGTREGRLVRPTLLEGVPPTAKLAHEEAFAPVLTLSSFTSADEAFALVNGSRFGLQASVFTRTPTVAERAFRDLEVGAVVWNDHPSMRFDVMPYGGVKRSGIGREGLRYAYEAMSTPKVLLGRR